MPEDLQHARATNMNRSVATEAISLRNAQPIMEMLLPAITQEPGLTESLRRFTRQNDGPTARFAQSLFDGLTHGESFEKAIRHAQPFVPLVLQDLLILGCE